MIRKQRAFEILFWIVKNGALIVIASLFTIILAEAAFRVLLTTGWVKSATETYSGEPYGFFLWSREGGYPYGVSNRFTYLDHDYDLEKLENNRIMVIGDSFVEALQVNIDQKMGPLLQALLNYESFPKYSVLSFGRSGEYPAHYLERYKSLDLIFKPEATFVLIYMGNDFRNSSQKIEQMTSGLTADRYISYLIDPVTGTVKMDPRSTTLAEAYRSGDKNNFKIRAFYQPSTKKKVNNFFLTHFLLYSEVPYRFALLKRKFEPTVIPSTTQAKFDNCAEETIYLKSHAACWSESMAVMQHIMHTFRQYQDASKSKVYFIGIPANETFWGDATIKKIVNSHGSTVPINSYDQYLAKKYDTTIADVDLNLPNKMLKKIMLDENLSYIDLHDRFYKELTENKRQVYCRWVNGHLCPEGHKIVAEEMKKIINHNNHHKN
jgi:hypothetical protein